MTLYHKQPIETDENGVYLRSYDPDLCFLTSSELIEVEDWQARVIDHLLFYNKKEKTCTLHHLSDFESKAISHIAYETQLTVRQAYVATNEGWTNYDDFTPAQNRQTFCDAKYLELELIHLDGKIEHVICNEFDGDEFIVYPSRNIKIVREDYKFIGWRVLTENQYEKMAKKWCQIPK